MGEGTTVTLIDAKRPPEWVKEANPDDVALWLGLVPHASGLVSWDVFDAVLTPGDIILLMSWRDQAALLFAGAFLALLLEVLFSPWHRTDAERKVLSLSFERLAEVASAADDNLEPPCKSLQTALAQSQAILFEGDDHRPQGRAFFALHSAAEQMRLLLIVLQH